MVYQLLIIDTISFEERMKVKVLLLQSLSCIYLIISSCSISYCTLLEQTAPRKKLAPTNSLIPSKYSREHRQYSFGWESQLLEMGFLAMFLSPVLSLSQFSRHTPTSWTNVWGNCWMIFRIIIGACLIKMRGDTCWRDLTCMNYHYEIPAEQGHTYASEVNAIFAETSALTARNVEEMFIEITRKLPPDCLTSLPA
ncbi:PREDICTED: lipase maturation factor 1-like isoform X2 [Amphimedon queenslandica]|uniref:Lipase maturation factor n=1 Tax=Amphimedon queenslandica TaxID=400682 RepID=A0AAN0JT92_AMPQE|nr:PREDICTED: lipase maturation factor 1-like isoform X2 [Amphimedon queenslandica]|eukprot:XP_019860041.1 PREDICTED: lipase maturation factor 1-like isoform X2 [Amphimedon queenslandica]